jgi:glycosyltransferase involved in cell wall biosynthesis
MFVKPTAVATKKMQVAFMPDKRPKEWPLVRDLLAYRHPRWARIPWVPIRQVSRKACAQVMAESAVFASFSYLEGLGLPPLEAMASGCLVCGFDGHGGADYANAGNGLWVREGDHAGFADALAQALAATQGAASNSAVQQLRAGGFTTTIRYSQARFERELIRAWQAILGPRWGQFSSATGHAL